MLEVKNLTVKYRFGARALNSVSFCADKNEIFCVLGGEESGKTTLMKTLAGLLQQSEGEIYLNGVNITDSDVKTRNVCLVHEDYGFFENKTLAYNLSYPLIIRGENKTYALKKIEEAAVSYGIGDFLNKKTKKLDEKTRLSAAMLRTGLRSADLYLLDDPFSGLREKETPLSEYLPEIKNLSQKSTVVFATSSAEEATLCGGKIAVLNYGVIEQCGCPDFLRENPASCFVYRLFHPSAKTFRGFLGEDSEGIYLSYEGINKRLPKENLLSDAFIGGEVIVCDEDEGKQPFIFDVQSEKLIYFC